MRKLTETQRETIINECRVLPIREAYNKLGLNVTRQYFYGILKYYKVPLCRVNHKNRSVQERKKQVLDCIKNNPRANKRTIMKLCRIGLYDLNKVLNEANIVIKTRELKNIDTRRKILKEYFQTPSNLEKTKSAIRKELRIGFNELTQLLEEMNINLIEKPKTINEKATITTVSKDKKGFCNLCGTESILSKVSINGFQRFVCKECK